jgi:hypothetical protein
MSRTTFCSNTTRVPFFWRRMVRLQAAIIKRKKHINIRYFFITDRVSKEEVSVVWCRTGDMIGYYATKPLQGGSIPEV